jgi:hypothetical protein
MKDSLKAGIFLIDDDLNPLAEFRYFHEKSGKEKILRCVFVPVEREKGEIFIRSGV